ncbi:hypothetical protein BS78_K038400 [Paspalum vaginatum]|uniref:Uncharacterized protein n=1 Tax=Paspalum vaginatum TaxID=158149 RepID=A0A9W7X8T8_9POAL|nr:hypothetical protein BS78_K038400 [Paspalum vaginatum]
MSSVTVGVVGACEAVPRRKGMKTTAKRVEVLETAVVAPSKETPGQPLWLSNLDLAVPRTHTPLVYYYPASAQAGAAAPGMGFLVLLERMKTALAMALVPFYPLAGRLSVGADGRPQIDCNGQGALFVVAKADLAGEEIFEHYEPSPEVRRTFVPSAPSNEAPCPMAMFQVTFLKCGGVVLGTGIHHAVMDGVGAFQFIQTWSGLSRGLDVAEACGQLPFHDRSLLRARCPPCPTHDHFVYSRAFLSGRPRPFVTRVYSVSPDLLADLKSRCGSGASTYCVVTAHLWRCVCVARGFARGSDTRLGIPANIRSRVSPPLPRGFFGNAVVRDLVTARVGDVLDSSLGSVAAMVKEAVNHVDDAFVRSVVDYLELEYGNGGGGGTHAQASSEQLAPASDLWAVSWLGMSMYDADFGSGEPRFVAPAQMFGVGTAYMTPCADSEDGIAVLFALEAEYMNSFEKAFYGKCQT